MSARRPSPPWSKRAVVSVRNRLGTPTTTDELRIFVEECTTEAIRIDEIEENLVVCWHLCCKDRMDDLHSHFLEPEDCPQCKRVGGGL